MVTDTAINLKCESISATKRQHEDRLAYLVVCATAIAMLHCQQAVAGDSAASIQDLNSTSSDNNTPSQQARNREWIITPSLGLEEAYSDNVKLAPRGSEESDWVSQINPRLSLTGTGPNLKVNANYQMQNLFHAKNSIGQITEHQLNANARAKLIDDFFFMDGTATINQQNISALGTLAVDNTNVNSNRTDVRTYSIAPYLQHRFRDIASGELRYIHGKVTTGVGGLANSQTDNILLDLNSGTAFKTLGWGINYNKQRMNYTQSIQNVNDTGSESFSGTLRYLVTPHFALNATGGYEKYDYLSITGQKPEGSSLTAGFSWAPSARTNIEASAGHKYFGTTYSLKASFRAHRTSWSLNYTEDVTTTQSQFLLPSTIDTSAFLNNLWASSIPDPVQRQQIVNTFISSNGLPSSLADPVNYLTNQTFLQKLFQASVAMRGKRNTFMLSVYGMLRKSLTSSTLDSALLGASNFASNDSTRQVGVNVLWDWKLSSRTSANISANVSGTGGGNRLRSFQAGIARQFQSKLNGSVILRRTQQDSDQIGVSYRENAIIASLLMAF
jgi:uncharacterized protein (PEP-CTERM system associated)